MLKGLGPHIYMHSWPSPVVLGIEGILSQHSMTWQQAYNLLALPRPSASGLAIGYLFYS